MRIAIDAMGGDNAPAEIVKGAVHACDRVDAQLILVGREEQVQAELDQYEGRYEPGQIVVRHAEEVIEGDDHPVQAIRRKKNSSMLTAIDMVRDGEADAALSAGNTGALMVGSLMHLGRLDGVDRPAIVYPLPNISAPGFSLLVDAGANAECKASHLLGFARMGTVYMKTAFGIEAPRVGLINIGTEETKGTEMLKEAYRLLKESGLNFIGNVEAREIPAGAADVLVCDGFTGNIVLKLTEGVAYSTLHAFKDLLMEEYVYVTLSGSKYHNSSDCIYLKTTPVCIDYDELVVKRNNSGGKYYPCERCKRAYSGVVYITWEGSKYHSESDCPSLKRTVNIITLKEALDNGYSACSRCG
ncbi:MAG: phosphate acyltransferase PlsX [Firmicutes bacterium]|nr:phosphate acyltransferase PlsX [Bacillota bacterium]